MEGTALKKLNGTFLAVEGEKNQFELSLPAV